MKALDPSPAKRIGTDVWGVRIAASESLALIKQ